MSAHTPGPWHAELGETYDVRDANGGRIAMGMNLKGRHGMGGRREAHEVAANVILMAASPWLANALFGLLSKLGEANLTPEQCAIVVEACDEATAALIASGRVMG